MTHDNRPYIEVKILDFKIVGLLDSGSNITILGKGGFDIVRRLNLKIFSPNSKFVHTADNKEQHVRGLVHLPIEINEECHLVEALVVPSLNHNLIFGSDFCQKFGIKIDYLEGSWEIQQNNVSLVTVNSVDSKNELEHRKSLSPDQKVVINELLQSFKEVSGEKRLGRTDRISLTIDTGDAKPFRRKQFPMSPYMMKILNEELDDMLHLGVVEPSNSPWCSPVILVKKKIMNIDFALMGAN